jgi:hypothetical protein
VPDEVVDIDLIKGKQREDAFRHVNPQMVLPALVDGDGPVLFQSLAIMEYLDETHPQPPLLPKEPRARARVRGLAQIVACDSHPLLVPRVREYLEHELKLDEPARLKWIQNWIGARSRRWKPISPAARRPAAIARATPSPSPTSAWRARPRARTSTNTTSRRSRPCAGSSTLHAERRLRPRASHAPARRAAGGLIGPFCPALCRASTPL